MKYLKNYKLFESDDFSDKILTISEDDVDLAQQLAIGQGTTLKDIIINKLGDNYKKTFEIKGEEFLIKFKINEIGVGNIIYFSCVIDKSSFIYLYDEKYSLEDAANEFGYIYDDIEGEIEEFIYDIVDIPNYFVQIIF